MFIYNLKLNSSIIFKIILIIIILIVFFLCFLIGFKIYKASIDSNHEILKEEIIEINNDNYSNVLKSVHDNIDNYIGKKIKFSGYVYRVYDLDKHQFILARNMLINSNIQSVVIGFLCHYNDANLYKDSTWIEIEGKITKGKYQNSDMPILEILSIKECKKPINEYVSPPDDSFVPTSSII